MGLKTVAARCMVERPTSTCAVSLACVANYNMLPDSANQSGRNVRPPCRGAVRDFGREEVIRQQRLSERVHRLAQLRKPIPDTTVSSRNVAPLGSEQGPLDRSRSPPLHAASKRQLLPVEAAAGHLLQSTVNPATLPSQPQATPVGELATSRAVSRATDEYARILSICSTFLEVLAQECAANAQRGAPRAYGLIRADLRRQDRANDLVAHVLLACRCHDEEHDTTLAARLQQDLDDVYFTHARASQPVPPNLDNAANVAFSRASPADTLVKAREEPASRPTPLTLDDTLAEHTTVRPQAGSPSSNPTSEDTPLPGVDATPPSPCSPGSSTLASQEAEAMRESPPRPPAHPRRLRPRDPVPICVGHRQEAAGAVSYTHLRAHET